MHLFWECCFWGSAALLGYTYAGYPLLLWWLARGKTTPKPLTNDWPTVTVCLAAHNEETVIRQRLENLLAQDYPDHRLNVVVGSDDSSDRTVDLAREFEGTGRVRVLDSRERRGKLGTLNEVVREATGDLLVFTDANCQFTSPTIRELVPWFADPTVGCVAGEKTIRTTGAETTGGGEGLYWRIESWIKQKESDLGSCAGADGSVYAVRKELYPFTPPAGLVMDDFLVSLSVIMQGRRCVYEPRAKAIEASSADLASEWKRKGRILAGAINVVRQMPVLLLPGRSPIWLPLWSHKILRWLGGWFLLCLLISHLALGATPFYGWLLLPHAGLYFLAGFGWWLQRERPGKSPFTWIFYFLFMNYAQLGGLCAYRGQCHRAAWEKLGR